MGNQGKRDRWLEDVRNRQRSIVFPETVQNEARFWRNLGTGPWTTSSKVGLAILAVFVVGWGSVFFRATHGQGEMWMLVLLFLGVCGPIFLAISWATRRTLKNIHKGKHGSHR